MHSLAGSDSALHVRGAPAPPEVGGQVLKTYIGGDVAVEPIAAGAVDFVHSATPSEARVLLGASWVPRLGSRRVSRQLGANDSRIVQTAESDRKLPSQVDNSNVETFAST